MTPRTFTAVIRRLARLQAALAAGLISLLMVWPVQASAATSQIQANVCPPAVVKLNVAPSDNQRTGLSRITVAGYTTSGLTIAVKANGKSYPPKLISGVNRFVSIVPLKPGRNQVVITASNACGQSDKRVISVYRTHGLVSISPLTLSIFWLILLIILILLLLWLLIYKRRRQKKAEDEQNQNNQPAL